MRDRFRKVVVSAAAVALLTVSLVVPAHSAQTCESLVNKAALKLTKKRLAVADCRKSKDTMMLENPAVLPPKRSPAVPLLVPAAG